jgi:hypothetical protein
MGLREWQWTSGKKWLREPPPNGSGADLSMSGVLRISSVRLLHSLLAFASSTVVWILCVAAPILIAIVLSLGPVILLAIRATLSSKSISDAVIEAVVVAVILLVTLASMPAWSTAILRLSLRLSPLPVGIPARLHVAPTLWLSWLLVLGMLIVSGSERITLLVALTIGACGVGRVYHFRYRTRMVPSRCTPLDGRGRLG